MSVAPVRVAAVDLGATSGRVMVGTVAPDRLELEEAHRFANHPIEVDGSLRWDLPAMQRDVLAGLRLAHAAGPLDGIGIDSWAIDYGLLDASGKLLGLPYCYRDARTDGIASEVHNTVPATQLYDVTGLQELPFTTIYQLVAAHRSAGLEQAATLLLLPDLLVHWLTGHAGAERTNASTTGLYDVRSRAWATDLLARLDVPSTILPPLWEAGERVGPVTVDAALAGVPVFAVGSHDTASAVVAVPSDEVPSAFISSGTWSLVGLELPAPVITEEARLAGFTNEEGVDGTTRFLTNVMGLWVLSESIRTWAAAGEPGVDLASLLAAAEEAEPLRTVVDIDDPRLLPPGDQPARLAALARETGQPVPQSPAEFTRCILDSLAVAYRRQVRRAGALADRPIEVVHVVGGGVRNDLLCQLTADACGLPVLAGPAEASALGNVLVQARSIGADLPDLRAMRDLVRRTHDLRRFEPRPGLDWAAAEERLHSIAPHA